MDLTRRSFGPSGLVDGLRQERIDVRRLERGDEAAFAAYLAASWGAGWQYQGLQALRCGREPIPGHLALAGDAVIGFAVYDVTRPGWFGPIGTAAERRGRSVGTALLHACLFDWQRQGRQRGEIAGIGPLYVYVTACDAAIARLPAVREAAVVIGGADGRSDEERGRVRGRPTFTARPRCGRVVCIPSWSAG